ncbi:hypothetical protein DVH05_012601 [Phytophthora capsici]|nr:hypothetical protein DVH05_012601 [Phytophthora capsici]
MESGLTIEDKLERKCPQFQRMKDIFGGKPNVKPADILQLGLPAPISEHLCAADAEHGRNEDEVAGEGILVQGGGGDSDAPTEYSEDLLCEDKTSSCQGSPNILHEPLPLLSPGDCTDLSRDLVSTSDVFSDAQSDCQKAPNSRPKVPIRTGRTDLALRLFGISSSSESDGEGYHENQPPTRSQPCAEQPTRLGIKPKRSNSKGLPYEAGTKRVRDDQRNTSKEASRKKSRTTTHQNNLSLAETHLNVSLQKQKMQQGFMYDQLEFTKKKWYEEKEEKQNQREMDRERREQESASRKATERHQFLVALIKKDKSASEIKELLAIYDAGE